MSLFNSPYSLSHCTDEGGKVEKIRVKLGAGRREGWEDGVFNICFDFALSNSDLIDNKLNFFFPKSGCLCPSQLLLSDFSLSSS